MFPKLNAFLHRRSILSGHSSQSPSGRLLFIVAQHTTHEKTFNGQQKGETRKKERTKVYQMGELWAKIKKERRKDPWKDFSSSSFSSKSPFCCLHQQHSPEQQQQERAESECLARSIAALACVGVLLWDSSLLSSPFLSGSSSLFVDYVFAFLTHRGWARNRAREREKRSPTPFHRHQFKKLES